MGYPDNIIYKILIKFKYTRRIWWFFNKIQGKIWIKDKRRSVRVNIDDDNWSWLISDLEDLKKINPNSFRSDSLLNAINAYYEKKEE